jgi:hypothetical protein
MANIEQTGNIRRSQIGPASCFMRGPLRRPKHLAITSARNLAHDCPFLDVPSSKIPRYDELSSLATA